MGIEGIEKNRVKSSSGHVTCTDSPTGLERERAGWHIGNWRGARCFVLSLETGWISFDLICVKYGWTRSALDRVWDGWMCMDVVFRF